MTMTTLSTITTTTATSSSSSSKGLPGECSQYSDGPDIKPCWRLDFLCTYRQDPRLNPPVVKWVRDFPEDKAART